MRLTRREFQRLSLASAANFLLPAVARAEEVPAVALQPLAAQIARMAQALESLGTPLPAATMKIVEDAQHKSRSEAEGVASIVAALAPHVLLEVDINPEMRLSMRRGAAKAELVQQGWRSFLVRVNNAAGATTPIIIKSPQGGSMGRRSSFAITGVHDFTNGAVDMAEARERWIAINNLDAPPMAAALSGLALEYRIVQLWSRDAGDREATLTADAGFGDQDLGFRSSVAILFRVSAARTVRLEIRDEKGSPSIASLLVIDGLHRVYPPQAKRSMPDLNFQPQVYRYNGEHLLLPSGDYDISFTRGPEYLLQHAALRVDASANAKLSLQLERWIDPARAGYYSGDTHIHAAGCSHYESPTEGVTPLVMQRQVDGEALALGSVLNWGPGFEYQSQFFTGHPYSPDRDLEAASHHHDGGGMPHDSHAIAAEQDAAMYAALQKEAGADPHSLVRYDVEVSGFPSSHCGHLVLLRLKEQRYPNTRSIDEWPSWNIPILRWAKQQGAAVGYAHSAHGLVVDSTELPNLLMPPFNSMGANEFIADVTHDGLIDFISGCDLWPFAELNIWYHTMNCGYHTAFAGETDFPCLTDACVGGGRSYAALSEAPSGEAGYTRWIDALVNGSSYFGDGRSHIFEFAAHGKQRSREPVSLAQPQSIEVTATVCARLEPQITPATREIRHASPYNKPYWHIERARIDESRRVPVELIVNGVPVERQAIEADGAPHAVRFQTQIAESSWIALRVYPSSHTNPIFIEVAGKPVRSSLASAQWCRRAVDVCWEQKKKRIRPEELAAAAEAYDHARAAYDRILRECGQRA